MIVATAAEMRRMDALAIERFGIPAVTLMERAGAGAAEALLDRFPHVKKTGVVVVAGKGNNGGDGFVVARLLKKRRVRCEVLLVADPDEITGPALAKLRAWERARGKTTVVTGLDVVERALGRAGCVVDGLYGTGLRGDVGGLAAEIITLLNATGLPTLALDLPSGLHADRGEPLGVAVQAELTVAFAAPKIGTVVFPGVRYAGRVAVVDIGIPEEAAALAGARTWAVDAEEAATLVRPRDPEGHKGDHGHVAILAGGLGKTGAAVLAARAASRGGAGLVTVGCPASVQPVVAGALVEQMSQALPDRDGLFDFPDPHAYAALFEGKTVALAGPGIGTGRERTALIEWLLAETTLPLVLDADGLNALAELHRRGAVPRPGRRPLVLTPHPGEMARLTGLSTRVVQADRLATARRVAAERGAVVVLKGARTVTADPEGNAWINLSGNPGLGSGGTGDVLGGLIASLLAQGLPPAEAARLGVWLHGHAADRVAARIGDAGLVASDVIAELPAATADLVGRWQSA